MALMTDTIRIERPLFSRRQSDTGGRVKEDAGGKQVLVRTRIGDTQELPSISEPVEHTDTSDTVEMPAAATQDLRSIKPTSTR